MNNIFKVVFVLLVTIFIGTVKVNAVETKCTYKEKANLLEIAGKITANYKINETEEDHEYVDPDSGETKVRKITKAIFVFGVYNITDDIYITQTNDYNTEKVNIFYDKTDKGVYKSETDNISDIIKYTFNIHSNLDGCKGEILKTFVFTKPKFNIYSEYSVCEGLENNNFCQKYIKEDLNLSEHELYGKIYEMNKAAIEKEKKEKDNKEGILDFVTDNYIYFISGAIAISLTAAIIIIIRKRRDL